MRKFKRDRGFLVFAQNGAHDYLRMAYGLALSLKASQSQYGHLSVAITPGMDVPEKYLDVFDEVIDIPWIDEASNSEWKLENEWKAFHITPYKETIKMDADMIVPSDIAHWWNRLSHKDVWASTHPVTYRGQIISSDYYRKTFTSNNLPNIYTALMYFKANENAQKLFEMAEIIYHNWQKFFYEYLDETRPNYVSTDVVFALAMQLIDGQSEMTGGEFPSFVHMKTRLQDWSADKTDENWMKYVSPTITPKGGVKIGRFNQDHPVHYHNKIFLTDAVLRRLERAAGL